MAEVPKLTPERIKSCLEYIKSPHACKLRADNYDRYKMYHGSIKDMVERNIRNEFKPETVAELCSRLIPINVGAKIINKLATVYVESPTRSPADKDELDQELINEYEAVTDLNSRQKEHNRYFKLFKRNLQYPYVDKFGRPQVRNLPAHTYEVFSTDPISPEIPDIVVTFMNLDQIDLKKERYAFWTDNEHLIIDGASQVVTDEMILMKNPNGENPIGALPFVYTNESSYEIQPIPDDDLLRIGGVCIPLLLSDLSFATKYLSWAVIYTIGAQANFEFSPNSIISLEVGPSGDRPEIGTIKPSVNVNDTLRFIEFLVATLLTTKNLSTSSISGELTSGNAASGVSKALDSAESIEDKKDQQGYFYKAEHDLWWLLSKKMIPYWRRMQLLAPKFNREFSPGFDLTIIFREPKPMVSEKEQIEVSKMKIDYGFSTLRRELQMIYSDYDNDEILDLELEIADEKDQKRLSLAQSFSNVSNISSNDQEDQPDEEIA